MALGDEERTMAGEGSRKRRKGLGRTWPTKMKGRSLAINGDVSRRETDELGRWR